MIKPNKNFDNEPFDESRIITDNLKESGKIKEFHGDH